MGHIAGVDRQQRVLFPEALDDYIAAENPVRFLDAFVESLDLAALGFARTTPAATGRPGYHPGDLLRLYIYGYLHRIRSSRRLEQESQRNLELMWLLRRLTPDFKTIADFRKDHPQALKQVCREFTLLCKRLDLFAGELVAIDGSKFRADNSKARNFTAAQLETRLVQIEAKVEHYLAELDRSDAVEIATPRPSAEALQKKIERLRQRQSEYQDILGRLQESGDRQISLTDPESRSMKTRGGTDVCYNVQSAVDAKYKLIIAQDVTNDPTDRDWLSPMALEAKEILGVEHLDAVADQGYYHGQEVKTCLTGGVTPYVPRPITSANEKHGLFTKDDFTYNPAQDVYHCPGNETLTFRFETTELGRRIRYYSTSACKQCPLKTRCTRNQQSRRITRWVDEHLLEAMEARLAEQPEMMQRRKELAEHPFGTLKRGMNCGYFLLRGLEKVRGEFSLMVLAYNLKRVIRILGVPRMIAAVS